MCRISETYWHPLMSNAGRVGADELEKKVLSLPQKWERRRTILVSPTLDLFDDDVPFPRILRIFDAMHRAPWHTYQVFTSNSSRLVKMDPFLAWSSSIWMGVVVQDKHQAFRIDHLRQTGAEVKCIAFEPLLGSVPNVDLTGIDWAIVGGDHRPGTRSLNADWVRDIRDPCLAEQIPFFFRNWGGSNRKSGRLLDGRTWDEMPSPVRSASALR